MRYLIAATVLVLIVCSSYSAFAEEITVIAPGGMRCALGKFAPEFEKKTSHRVKWMTGSGGVTHQQVVKGEPFDVPIVQPPVEDVLASGNVVASTQKPLATVAVVVVVRKGTPKPDISTPEAVKKMLLGAKAISYPNGAGGAAAGVSFDGTQKKLGIFEQMQPKVKRVQGVALLDLLTKGDIDVAVTFASEVDDPGVEVVGPLPREISTPTALIGFVSSHAKAPEAARAFLNYISSSEALPGYKACLMTPGK